MANPRVQIDVTANTQQAQQNLKGFQDSFTELKSKLDLVFQAAQEVGKAFQFAFDLAEQGAVVKQTGESFGFLLENIGAVPDLLDQLREKSLGTIPELKLMSATTTLLAGAQGELAKNLANASPQLLEIAKAANKLNPSLGDTTFLYESLATGIKRSSPFVIDNLGLIVKIGEANKAYADELGKTVDQLTAAEKQQALLNATLDAGQVLIEQAGGTAASATDDYAVFETSVENLKNEFAALITEMGIVKTVIEGTAKGLNVNTQIIRAYRDGVITAGQAWELFAKLQSPGVYDRADLIDDLTRKTELAALGTLDFSDAIISHGHTMEDTTEKVEELGSGYKDSRDFLKQYHETQKEASEAAEVYQARLDKLNKQTAQIIENSQDLAPKIENLNNILNQSVGSPLQAFIEDIDFFLASGGRDFAAEFQNIQTALAEKVASEDTSAGQAALAMVEAKIKAGELLTDYLNLNIELGKETELGAATALSETLGISVEAAKGLLTDWDTHADEVFGEERALAINTVSLDELHEKLGEAEGGALNADIAIDEMIGTTEGAVPAANNFKPLASGLDQVNTSARNAMASIERLIQVAENADLSGLDPMTEHSPAPLAAGLWDIAGALPHVTSGLRGLIATSEEAGGFQHAGLVPNVFAPPPVPVMAHGGELAFSAQQQRTLFDMSSNNTSTAWGGGGGDTYNITVNDQMAGALVLAEIDLRRRDRLGRRMGG